MILKRFREKHNNCQPLDLHGVKHDEVCFLVEEYILLNQAQFPLKIITGNSNNMKKIVQKVLDDFGFEYVNGDYYNRGYITVLN